MTRFRKRPVEIDAIQWTADNMEEMKKFLTGAIYWFSPEMGKSLDKKNWTLCVITYEGTSVCSVGDWVIKGVKGEFYPCKPDIFTLTYEEVA